MGLYRIVLRLARNPGYPDGDDDHGYVIIAPLDAADRLDVGQWRAHSAACTVVRFKPGADRDADGLLTHNGSHWFFHYDEEREGGDEPVFRLGDHPLSLGEYVSVTEDGGRSLTYRVVERSQVHPATSNTIAKEIRS